MADVLKEMNIEFGKGQSLAVTNAFTNRIAYDKTGAKGGAYTKIGDLSTRNAETISSVNNVANYLKKKGVWDKVATKQSFKTTDLVFKADGSCQVNYDDGGGILIPKSIVLATTPTAQKTFIQKFKEKLRASVVTEEVLEESVKERVANFVKTKLIPYAVATGVMAGGIVGAGAMVKSTAKNLVSAVKIIAANENKLQVKAGNDTITYDASKNILTVNDKSEKADYKIRGAWRDAFVTEPEVHFEDIRHKFAKLILDK